MNDYLYLNQFAHVNGRDLQGIISEVNDLVPLYCQRQEFGDHPNCFRE